MSKKLNLGSGEFKKPGYVNVDYFSVSEPDVRHNLEEFPYPFQDGEFELIEADHVLEHLSDPFRVMKELHRIAMNGAEIIIRVPHFSRGFTHAEHKRGFDVTFPLYFDPKFPGGYQGFPLAHKKTRLCWFAQPYLKKQSMGPFLYIIGMGFGLVFDLFANLSPYACSRIWCFWVGGFEEIEFRFLVNKS
jgi:SAM-dependent methyltransferase